METVYERMFGIKPCIVAGYPYATKQGGARVLPEVAEAMREASAYNVDIPKLLERAGQKIAEMLGVEAAFVTSGASAALTLASAAVMTGRDVRLMEQLPDTENPIRMKNELIMQRGHVTHYTACLKASGAKIIEVGASYLPRGRASGATWQEFNESWFEAMNEGYLFYPLVYDEAKEKYVRIFKVLPMHIENAINERTAALVYVRSNLCVRGEYEVPLETVVQIARKYNLPVICDFAAEAYKKSNIKLALEKGADLVIFSGGKDIGGPNDTGLVLGRKDLIEAIAQNSNPHYRFIIGRGFKVSREQIVGFVLALEKFLQIDEKDQFKRDLDLCHYICDQFKGFPYVDPSVYIPDDQVEGIFHQFPQVHLKLDEKALGLKAHEIAPILWLQDPPIYLTKYLSAWGIVEITTHLLQDGEADVIIPSIKRILSRSSKIEGKEYSSVAGTSKGL